MVSRILKLFVGLGIGFGISKIFQTVVQIARMKLVEEEFEEDVEVDGDDLRDDGEAVDEAGNTSEAEQEEQDADVIDEGQDLPAAAAVVLEDLPLPAVEVVEAAIAAGEPVQLQLISTPRSRRGEPSRLSELTQAIYDNISAGAPSTRANYNDFMTAKAEAEDAANQS